MTKLPGLLCAAVVALWTTAASAQTAVDLQLVLAVDASGSVNDVRFELQKQGYAAAFRHPRVLSAIRQGAQQAIAVTMVTEFGVNATPAGVGGSILRLTLLHRAGVNPEWTRT